MPKLYFKHGVVNSAKTLNLLALSYSYKAQGKSVALMKPSLDTRFGDFEIKSRAGISQRADYIISNNTNILELPAKNIIMDCILVDEVQFLQPSQIDQLRMATYLWNTPIFCYGLRTDFRSNLFPGSKRLMEVADVIEEIETVCHFCHNTAILNLKHVNGIADTSGPAVQLGAEEKYFPTCFSCYRKKLIEVNQLPSDMWK
eukprot:gene10059-13519_t